MYNLYYAPGTASMAVHWMLMELDVPYNLTFVDIDANEHKSPRYLALNPSGQVPTLLIDGAPHTETAALLMLLAERHPDAGLQPPIGDPLRPAALELMFYLANVPLPGFRAWFYPADLSSAASADDVREHTRRRIEQAFQRLDDRLAGERSFLLGERFSIADILATTMIRWSRNMPKPGECWPNLAAYATRMRARPALRWVHEREGLTDWIDGNRSL